jgi:hypothetical protein
VASRSGVRQHPGDDPLLVEVVQLRPDAADGLPHAPDLVAGAAAVADEQLTTMGCVADRHLGGLVPTRGDGGEQRHDHEEGSTSLPATGAGLLLMLLAGALAVGGGLAILRR